ncbi:aminopeptidase [Phanerochaete sordida]|uniref:Aminopeptidase n=1 Tax=Phanerochaete sordida TaxID=48140 RepID=A0A9P3GLM4_9APHY|nr:aminopeptidase [Phanerochaete sordida]
MMLHAQVYRLHRTASTLRRTSTAVGSLERLCSCIVYKLAETWPPQHPSALFSGKMVDDAKDRYRLPTNVRPRHYDLTVRTDLEELKFDGYVTVHLDILEETRTIQFHVLKLKLEQAKLTSPSLNGPIVQHGSEITFDEDDERATMNLSTTLPAGTTAELRFEFESELLGSLTGYYRSSWECQGKTSYYALTHFEPTAARRAFPCWDEPALKATYTMQMVSRAHTVNLANMSVHSESIYAPHPDPDSDVAAWLSQKLPEGRHEMWKVTTFQKTPLISTYIVAWANGPFSFLEAAYTSPLTSKTCPLRIYATPDLVHQAQFALDIARRAMPIYEQVFDIEYPLPKLDFLVANDFNIGAMENWGLITGRTTAFLVDPLRGKLLDKKGVTYTVCHEIAHMWFGNITTMDWWDTVYLKEGFARLVGETIIAGKLFPEWRLRQGFVRSEMVAAMRADAKLSSHPIEVECPDAKMANQIFDAMSYDKGATILRMLSGYVTEEKFLKGASLYLKKHLYGNAVTKDLWRGVAEASGMDVPRIMDNWVKKTGFPIVQVTELDGGIRVRQDRFLETGPADPKDNETIWSIPLTILAIDGGGKASVDRAVLLDEREKVVSVDTSKPFKLNAGTIGMYRVLYGPERLAKIAQEAAKRNSVFSLEDRLGLLLDALVLSKAGYSLASSVLTLYNILRDEEDRMIWLTMADGISEMSSVWFEQGDIVENLDKFCRDLFGPIVKRLGTDYSEDEDIEVRQLRTAAIQRAARAGDSHVVDHILSLFNKATATGDDTCIPPDLVTITYEIAVKYGGRKEWDVVEGIITTAKTPQVKRAAMVALGATRDRDLQEETWSYIMTKARDQDLYSYFAGLQGNPTARHFLAEKFKADYDTLHTRTAHNFRLQHLVWFSFTMLSSMKDYEETAAFFKDRDTSTFSMSRDQALESIEARAAWVERSSEDLRQWFEKMAEE